VAYPGNEQKAAGIAFYAHESFRTFAIAAPAMVLELEIRALSIAACMELFGARLPAPATVLFIREEFPALAMAAGLFGAANNTALPAVLFIREYVHALAIAAAPGLHITGAPAGSAVVFIPQIIRALAIAAFWRGFITALVAAATVVLINLNIHAVPTVGHCA
jgi:hypothetical protein